MKHRLMQAAWTALLVAGLTAVAIIPASAHHSFAAFDTTKQTVITGTIKKVDWTNPHTWFWVDVTNDKGETETWGIEGMSPNFLERRGWTRKTLSPGDKITVTLRPMKDGQKGGMWVTAKRPNGDVLSMGGAVTNP